MEKIAIVGSGFSGLAVASSLIRYGNNLEISMFDPGGEKNIGRGQAWRIDHLTALINTRTEETSLFIDKPQDFYNWVKKQIDGLNLDSSVPDNIFRRSHLPRGVFGCYLNDASKKIMEGDEKKKIKIKFIPQAINNLCVVEGGLSVTTTGSNARSESDFFDKIVICTGPKRSTGLFELKENNQEGKVELRGLNKEFASVEGENSLASNGCLNECPKPGASGVSSCSGSAFEVDLSRERNMLKSSYIENPYPLIGLKKISIFDSVATVGSGLTAIDVWDKIRTDEGSFLFCKKKVF